MPKGLTYEEHACLNIDLNIAGRKAFNLINDLLRCYPANLGDSGRSILDSIAEIKTDLESQAIKEAKEAGLPRNSWFIYSGCFGSKLCDYLSPEIVHIRKSRRKGKKKPKFTTDQYYTARATLKELDSFFSFLHYRVEHSYSNTRIVTTIRKAISNLQRFQAKLERVLRKEHGENNEMFFGENLNFFFAQETVDPSVQHLIHRRIIASKAGDMKSLDEIEQIPLKKKITLPKDANQPAGLSGHSR